MALVSTSSALFSSGFTSSLCLSNRLFIIDAIITLPIALLGLVFLPALPGQRDWKPSFWLKQQDLEVIERRLASINRKPPAPFTIVRVKSYLAGWHIWVLPVLYVLWNNSLNAQTIMPLWLKSFNTVDTGTGIHYTVAQINHYIVSCSIRRFAARR